MGRLKKTIPGYCVVHKLKYCKICNAVYCTKCGQEWLRVSNDSLYYAATIGTSGREPTPVSIWQNVSYCKHGKF